MAARRALTSLDRPACRLVVSRPFALPYLPRRAAHGASVANTRGRTLPRKRLPACPSVTAKRALSSSAPARGKLQPFLLADIGEGITEVQVCSWAVKEGAKVEEFDAICEVQSDKATVDITSRYKGHIRKLYAKEGDVIRVGQPLCDIELDDDSPQPEESPPPEAEAASAPSPAPVPTTSQPAPSAETPTSKHGSLATPAVRRIAREYGIDISNVEGTGKDGRITKEDMQAYADQGSSSTSAPALPQPANAPSGTPTPLTGMRKAMFKAMSASLQIPHFAYSEELDVTELDRLRLTLNGAIPSRYRKTLTPSEGEPSDRVEASKRFDRITLLPLLLKALSRVLPRHPLFLSTLSTSSDGSPQLVRRSAHDLSIALSAPSGGLYTPLIPSVDTLSPFDIASHIAHLQSLVAGSTPRVPPALLQPGTLTLSNVGVIGGTGTHPVIPPTGQLAIGALGRIAVRPRYPDDAVARTVARDGGYLEAMPRLIMPVSFTADHRVVEGVELARLVEDWRKLVEKPMQLLGEGR